MIKKKIRPLCIFSPKISTYKIFDRYFIMKEKNVFDKYDEIWKTAILLKNLIVNLYTIKTI